jgi:ubiquinone/menaquinone biosynthesis C-methylase UbiE
VAPQPNDRILDVGCGTGSLALLLKRAQPQAAVFGLDPDGNVLARARRKATAARVEVPFIEGFLEQRIFSAIPQPTKVVSSLVFHQVPLQEKRRMLTVIRRALATGGELHIADYGLQRTKLMRLLFRTVQALDGKTNTEPNARGVLPKLMADAGFSEVEETHVIATATGSISLYRARVPS